jgi:hypothetical protein
VTRGVRGFESHGQILEKVEVCFPGHGVWRIGDPREFKLCRKTEVKITIKTRL